MKGFYTTLFALFLFVACVSAAPAVRATDVEKKETGAELMEGKTDGLEVSVRGGYGYYRRGKYYPYYYQRRHHSHKRRRRGYGYGRRGYGRRGYGRRGYGKGYKYGGYGSSSDSDGYGYGYGYGSGSGSDSGYSS